MKKYLSILLLSFSTIAFAQKDSLQLGDRYADDQIYIGISYNQLYDQPDLVNKSGFSYGLSVGFMKDIILNKSGRFSFAFGTGYGFDSFNHKLKVTEVDNITTFEVDNSITSNRISIHNIEFPIEFRWRTSLANKYKFWRIYTGFKLSYNFSNTFSYNTDTASFSFRNISDFNNWQYGVTLSVGYAAFNLHFYYGITPIFKNAVLGTSQIGTKILKFGLVFYIL